ncbi:MAG: MopE-related protein [Myxococcota bacterium]
MRAGWWMLWFGCTPAPDVQPAVAVDADGDGIIEALDCDDNNATISPVATELCDGVDNDCNNLIDDEAADAGLWFADKDGDGYGAAGQIRSCAQPDGYSAISRDCDDDDPNTYPGAAEICDDTDNDCDGDFNEDPLDPFSWYADLDSDGFGDPETVIESCRQPPGYITEAGDCDDFDESVFPGADVICGDGRINDCNNDLDAARTACLPGGLLHDAAAVALPGVQNRSQFTAPVVVGDANRDGQDDLLVTVTPQVVRGATPIAHLVVEPLRAAGTLEDGAESTWFLDVTDFTDARPFASSGDFDGDSWPDLAFGIPGFGDAGQGALYVNRGPFANNINLSSDAPLAIGLTSSRLGRAIAFVGDVQDDGYDDLLISAPTQETGTVYLLSGGSGPLPPLDEATVLSGGDDVLLTGLTLSPAGDTDGDGLDDFLIGARTDNNSGAIFLIRGGAALADQNLDDADIRYDGAPGDVAGDALAAAGDVNGDGVDDLLIGAPAAADVGEAYLILGGTAGGTLTTQAEALFRGNNLGDRAGAAVQASDDLNGDGRPELLIGAPNNRNRGAVYIISGADASGVVWMALDADAKLEGGAANDQAGDGLAALGDVNDDGIPDLAVGASGYTTTGMVYLLLGQSY